MINKKLKKSREFLRNKQKEYKRSVNLTYSMQLDNLKQTETNLKSLLAYIDDQKLKLKESQDILNNLQSEKKKLEPLVKADRDVVNAIFEFQDSFQSKERWFGYTVSFVLGILFSLMATMIAYALKSSKNKNTNAVINDQET